jgi:hypothetical protein
VARGRRRAQCMVMFKDMGRGKGKDKDRDRDRDTPARTGRKWVRPGRAGKERTERGESSAMEEHRNERASGL